MFSPAALLQSRRREIVDFGWIAALWGALWLVGFPAPMVDDLFYVGASISFAKGGPLGNPWARRWYEHLQNRFYVEPPVHASILGGWLRVFGTSTCTLVAFQFVCYLAASVALTRLLRGQGIRSWAIACVVITYALWMAEEGLRHDAVATALIAAGLVAVASRAFGWRTIGYAAIATGILCAPPLLAYALPFVVCVEAVHWRRAATAGVSPARAAGHALLPAIVGAAIAGGFLLFAIRGEVRRFLGDFGWFVSYRRPHLATVPSHLIAQIAGRWTWLSLGVTLVILAIANGYLFVIRRAPTRNRALVAAIDAGIALNAVVYALSFSTLSIVFSWIALIVAIDALVDEPRFAMTVPPAALCLFLPTHALAIVTDVVQLSSLHGAAARYPNLSRELAAVRGLVVDDFAGRFVFNYQLPDDALTFNNYEPAPGLSPESVAERAPGETWVVSRASGLRTQGISFTPLRILGRRINTVPTDSAEIVVIR